ncbi:hypothetical protein BOX15_Mlig004401g1 [Macrostomum lignano]|uniref:Uncharacterized protein n=1 Tax=Macrostomum lignano TaxID=282301 RepID=A0A267E7N7_9PLAT|nr:hypothetical protein BOX15_Mlig004401g1 [Macrostomum lignano]
MRPRRFKDSPPAAAAADAGSDSGADGAPAEAVGSEDAGLARSEEAPGEKSLRLFTAIDGRFYL